MTVESTSVTADLILSDAGLDSTLAVTALDEYGEPREGHVAAERALTLYLNKRELVTLMTLGSQPEMLVLGWLRNQRLVQQVEQVAVIQVDWETGAAAIQTHEEIPDLDSRLSRKTVTTGCGQGTVFGDMMEDLEKISLPQIELRQSLIYGLLKALDQHNQIYRRAGAVHGCALCRGTDILHFVEEVGRHNAVDTIAGHMWMEQADGHDKIFYTTGRLTSEMVIKVAQMGIPILLSRSGVTQMGLELAQKLGVTLVARAKGEHFLIYHGKEQFVYDQPPKRKTGSAKA
ncbi:formate dehydrogenase accessory sulfurtransferase FdhD [Sedimenticola sp.]|uniref:formate dehydrogenase accessory sulfurtransferase FdhD n=1 Tax=Sedimenticola sp. TaxID=1940285 RepID=UPI003D13ECD0